MRTFRHQLIAGRTKAKVFGEDMISDCCGLKDEVPLDEKLGEGLDRGGVII
jgi:hypothetical protein